jgi:hypothetical protein
VKLPWGDRHWLPVLWLIEACIAGGAVTTLARGGTPRDMLVTTAYFALCGVALTLPGLGLRLIVTALGISSRRRQLVLQLYLALAAAAVAAMLGTAHGWTAVGAIMLTGNALLTLELESRVHVTRQSG